ncbi:MULTISPECIES: glycosyltransferase family 2 protein [Bacillus amyloliquefaciens group]|uniref:glycosyltransferase family 2 protein n=1 Tax=Bacillus amyloliquefaciens group TaxID=1938374 RepID=UPI0004CF1F4A|nr:MULTISPECIES: glycosyltransferase family 2 protein [Bacillus amyloliquefaciens group]WRT07032.1 glycosyltransferase family 2 protein [Bacillus velezensis]
MNISIVIVTYNRIPALCELLESISMQTIKPYEVIIVNDAGESVEQAKQLYSDLPIQIIDLEQNAGHVEARNAGVKKASGDCIMLCDDDDFITPGHLERMAAALADADFVHSDAEIVSFEEQGGTRYPMSRKPFAYTADYADMRVFSTYVPSGSMYRRSLHDTLGYFDPDVHNYWDWDFYLRAAKQHRVKRVPCASVIYAFFEGGGNQSADLGGKRKRYLDRLSEKHGLGELPTKNFAVLLEEPDMKRREAPTDIVWDGKPVHSRLHSS